MQKKALFTERDLLVLSLYTGFFFLPYNKVAKEMQRILGRELTHKDFIDRESLAKIRGSVEAEFASLKFYTMEMFNEQGDRQHLQI